MRGEKFADQALSLLVFDAGEEFLSQLRDGLWPIKGQAVIDFASLEMARLTTRLKYRFDFFVEVRLGGCHSG